MRVNDNLAASLQGAEYDEIAHAVARATPEGGTVLDWGAGFGQLTQRLVDLGVDVHAYDYDPEADGVESGSFENYPELTALRTSDPVALPYDDATFDVVLGCGVLEHVEHPLASLMELRRILKPGGLLLVYKLPNRYSALEFVARVGGLPYHGMRVHDTLWGVRSAAFALEEAGFDVEWVRRANMLPLTVDHPVLQRRTQRFYRLNKRLAQIPGLEVLATNVEARARKPLTS